MAKNYGLPRIEAEGGLTADPELRYNNSGKPWATFTVAQSRRQQNRDTNEWEDVDTTYLDCVVNGELAENLASSLQKGARVFVRGRLRQREFTTQQGEKRRTFEVLVDSVGPLLDNATASVTRAQRGGSGGGYGGAPAGGGWANSGNGSQPSYGSTQGGGYGGAAGAAAPPAGDQFGGFDDEQPF